MKADTLPRDYAGLCIKNAESMHEQMKARGLYNGKTVGLPYKGKTLEIPIPQKYPVKILAAIAQLGEKKETGLDSLEALETMAELLLAVNGVDYPPDLLIEEGDLAKLMGTDGEAPKKARKPPKKN